MTPIVRGGEAALNKSFLGRGREGTVARGGTVFSRCLLGKSKGEMWPSPPSRPRGVQMLPHRCRKGHQPR